jgi:tetratricopeptide (TPR) repeat protein
LEFYERCIKITRKATTIDNIAVYVNKIACLLSLEKFDRVVTECNDALRLIKNFRNNEVKSSPEEKKRLHMMEVRVSVRRGNALAKVNRFSDAIIEYERAMKLDPTNEAIKKDLDILRKA